MLLHDPGGLATQNAIREHLLRNLLPHADTFGEEGMSDRTTTQPQLQTWRARRNLSIHSMVQTWNEDDPWRGIAAQVCQPPITYVDHDAILSTEIETWVTVVARPVWTWRTPDLVSGEFMVVVATTDPQPHYATDNADAIQEGFVPLRRLLVDGAAQSTTQY